MNRPVRGAGRRLALCAATLLTAGATVAGIGTAVTPTASAATSHGAVHQVICQPNVVKPHFLRPNHRSLATGGTVGCSVPASTIRVTITLFKDGRRVKSKTVTKHNADQALAFITYRCATDRAHAYQAVASGSVTFPGGHPILFKKKSSTVHLRCRG